jgi:hypothetical protein
MHFFPIGFAPASFFPSLVIPDPTLHLALPLSSKLNGSSPRPSFPAATSTPAYLRLPLAPSSPISHSRSHPAKRRTGIGPRLRESSFCLRGRLVFQTTSHVGWCMFLLPANNTKNRYSPASSATYRTRLLVARSVDQSVDALDHGVHRQQSTIIIQASASSSRSLPAARP